MKQITSYDGRMDIECIAICDAVNQIPGLRTVESCCGHGKDKFRVFFDVDDLSALPRLLYYCYFRHIGFRWNCFVETFDKEKVNFYIESESIGEKAYFESKKIAHALLKSEKQNR